MSIRRINGVNLYWNIDGSNGDPMVLVHGSWGDSQNWRPVVPAFSHSFRVLTYDRRGHSRSERLEGQGSVREDVADLAALLEEVGQAPAHVVGSSFGASIALRLAVERPELIRSLAVHEPPLIGLLKDDPGAAPALAVIHERISRVVGMLEAGDSMAGAREFIETIAFGPGAWSELSEEVRTTFINNAPTWLDESRDPESLELEIDGLRAFTAPALLTVGEQSPPFFPVVVDRIAGAIPHAERHTYAGAGHVPQLSHPAEYVRVITEFIRRGPEG